MEGDVKKFMVGYWRVGYIILR